MKYYYIKKSQNWYDIFGSSNLGISPKNRGFVYNNEHFWDYSKKIKLVAQAGNGATKLLFLKYIEADMYVLLMIPELKMVFEHFDMPEHRWYKAEAGYDKQYLRHMKKYFGIEYDINPDEKRPYWVLQFLNTRYNLEQLDFPNISFDLVDAKNYDSIKVGVAEKGIVKNFEEYASFNSEAYKNGTQALKIKTYVYRRNYDILWGGPHVVFNGKVKEALEATNIITPENGLEFVEFTDYEIEILRE